MIADISWWDLADSGVTVDELRADLTEERLRDWRHAGGLSTKLWLADEEHRRWGAVMLWTRPPRPDALPPNRARDLIGSAPAHRVRFHVVAAVRGPQDLHR
ncbi:hypothetical protein [Nocardia sp. NPDC020380]|uniref:hypothetical protein n=1 Tax=Nocardia sp. NPDC020380 TaxID=3364309 RepID=UPI003793C647